MFSGNGYGKRRQRIMLRCKIKIKNKNKNEIWKKSYNTGDRHCFKSLKVHSTKTEFLNRY